MFQNCLTCIDVHNSLRQQTTNPDYITANENGVDFTSITISFTCLCLFSDYSICGEKKNVLSSREKYTPKHEIDLFN